jgi:hypothetical protein
MCFVFRCLSLHALAVWGTNIKKDMTQDERQKFTQSFFAKLSAKRVKEILGEECRCKAVPGRGSHTHTHLALPTHIECVHPASCHHV